MLLAVLDVVDEYVVNSLGTDLVDGVEVTDKFVLVRAKSYHTGHGRSQAFFQGGRVKVTEVV